MIKEAIDRIQELANEAHGVQVLGTPEGETLYVNAKGAFTLPPLHRAEALEVGTLTAVIDYLKANRDELDASCLVVHVVDAHKVEVVSVLDSRRGREEYLRATHAPGQWNFLNVFRGVEDTIIWLQTHFLETVERASLLALLGNLTAENVRTLVDDGVTQEAGTRAGAVRSGQTAVKNPVWLIPRRSFPEVKLPLIPFVVRLKGGGDGATPTVALFECDGGEWNQRAVQEIKRYLTGALPPEVAVIA